MELNLKKPLVFFDLETTGLNITSDKIVEISYIKVFPNGTEESKTLRVNPGMHIPEQATAVHHITDDDVKDCPTFKQVARSLASVFEGSDVAGFNSNRFDIPIMACVAAGAGLTVLATITLVKRMFDRHHGYAYYAVLGLLIGSIVLIFPGFAWSWTQARRTSAAAPRAWRARPPLRCGRSRARPGRRICASGWSCRPSRLGRRSRRLP